MESRLTICAGSGIAAYCWTFIFRGGPKFVLRLNNHLGPGHDHNGVLTVWKFVGTEEEAAEAEALLRANFEGLRIERYTDEDDPEAERERQRRLFGFGGEESGE